MDLIKRLMGFEQEHEKSLELLVDCAKAECLEVHNEIKHELF